MPDGRSTDCGGNLTEEAMAEMEGRTDTVATYRVGLSRAEYERLALLAEEMGEAIQIVGKILRHGYDSCSPFDPQQMPNRNLLEKELGDVRHAMIRLCESGDLDKESIHAFADLKAMSVKQWLHFND